MVPDMKLGWKPKEQAVAPPIPLYYDYEPFEVPINPITNKPYEVVYYGPRFKHSIEIHRCFANRKRFNGKPTYRYKNPSNMAMIEHIIRKTHRNEPQREFLGMNPKILDYEKELVFESMFESGNLDTVLKRSKKEYDLYMRVDTNTRGHH